MRIFGQNIFPFREDSTGCSFPFYIFYSFFTDTVIDEYEDCDDEYKEELNLEELAVAFRIENGHNEEEMSASMNPLTPAATGTTANNLAPAVAVPQAVTPRTSMKKKSGDAKGKEMEHNGDIDVWWLYDDGGNA